MRTPSISRVATLGLPIPSSGKDTVADFLRRLARDLFDPYRPELHYMRGPGPKWRERHGNRGAR